MPKVSDNYCHMYITYITILNLVYVLYTLSASLSLLKSFPHVQKKQQQVRFSIVSYILYGMFTMPIYAILSGTNSTICRDVALICDFNLDINKFHRIPQCFTSLSHVLCSSSPSLLQRVLVFPAETIY